MYFCPKCKKKVVILSVSHDDVDEDEFNDLVDSLKRDGSLVLINPIPIPPYHCPVCSSELIEKQ